MALNGLILTLEVHSEPGQTSNMEPLAKTAVTVLKFKKIRKKLF